MMGEVTERSFDGFPPAGLEFLDGLAADNSKAYFDAHRKRYATDLAEPAKAFVEALGGQLCERVSPTIQALPKVNGSIFPINRDTRFSADKTPYKTNLGLVFWEGEQRKHSPMLYVGLDASSVTTGVGFIPISNLDGWRAGLDDPATGRCWDQAVHGAGFVEWAAARLEPYGAALAWFAAHAT